MRIVIEVQGDKVTSVSTNEMATSLPPDIQNAPLASPPLELLERAKKLGAFSAGSARFGRGAALASASPVNETPKPARGSSKKSARKRARRRA
jgi:hypothetical protein